MDALHSYRERITEIDKKIVALLNERAQEVIEIGRIKRERDIPVYNPAREQEIFDALSLLAKEHGYSAKALHAIYREIISASRALEAPLTAAYFGLPGSFTHAAALEAFGSSSEFLSFRAVSEVFRAVEAGTARFGVVPVENSNEGTVTDTLDEFVDSPLKICRELRLPINETLISLCSDIGRVKKVYSHPQPFAQCRAWLQERLPNAERIETASTSEAARVASWDKTSAAIGSKIAADIYGLTVLAEHIEDNPENYTRFLILGKDDAAPSGNDATSFIMSVKHEPDALRTALEEIGNRNVNMTKIESRPTKKKAWEYAFYITVDGHREDAAIAEMLSALTRNSLSLKLLGSYPKSNLAL